MAKDEFFKKMEELGIALTYDDVRLKTGYSETMPDNILTDSKFSRNVPLKIPIISAAMEISEHLLATELAKLGGLGIIHKALSADEQAAEVAKVKYHLNGLIEKPICVFEDETIEFIIRKKTEKGYGFNSFPVLDRNGKLVGILTHNDFDFCKDYSKTAKEEMTKALVAGKENTTLDEAYNLMIAHKKKAIPLVSDLGEIAGLYIFSDLSRIKNGTHSKYNVDKKGQLRVGAAIGVLDDAFARVEKLVKENIDVVVIDTAHGDSKPVFDTLVGIKKKYPTLDVVVGNISEPESAKRLLDLGADGLKIGQGPGSICTTRIIAGIGCPQVTAVYNCSRVADSYDVPICADGGLRYSGDIPIAIGAGAHSVMMGIMLAGTDEAKGETVFYNGRKWKSYRGMGSLGAMETSKASRERYGQNDGGKNQLIPEGIEGMVPYKGPLKDVVLQYVGGLKRGMGYVGAKDIDELQQKADFWRISPAGQKESHPHDIKITKESPNYPSDS